MAASNINVPKVLENNTAELMCKSGCCSMGKAHPVYDAKVHRLIGVEVGGPLDHPLYLIVVLANVLP